MVNRNMNKTEVNEFLDLTFNGNDGNIDLKEINQTMVPITPLGRIAARCCEKILIAAYSHWQPCSLISYLRNAQVNISEKVIKLCNHTTFPDKTSNKVWPVTEKFGRCLELGFQGSNSTNVLYCYENSNVIKGEFPDSFCSAPAENMTASEFLCESSNVSVLPALTIGIVSGLAVGIAVTKVGSVMYNKYVSNQNYAAALQSENFEKGSMLNTL